MHSSANVYNLSPLCFRVDFFINTHYFVRLGKRLVPWFWTDTQACCVFQVVRGIIEFFSLMSNGPSPSQSARTKLGCSHHISGTCCTFPILFYHLLCINKPCEKFCHGIRKIADRSIPLGECINSLTRNCILTLWFSKLNWHIQNCMFEAYKKVWENINERRKRTYSFTIFLHDAPIFHHSCTKMLEAVLFDIICNC